MRRQLGMSVGVLGVLLSIEGCGNPNALFFNDSFINYVSGGIVPGTPGPTGAFVLVRAVNSTQQNVQFVVTAEVPRLSDRIDIFALYSRQGFDRLRDLFTLNDTLVQLKVRWDLTEQFYVLIHYGRLWQLQSLANGTTDTGFRSSNDFNVSLGFAGALQ